MAKFFREKRKNFRGALRTPLSNQSISKEAQNKAYHF